MAVNPFVPTEDASARAFAALKARGEHVSFAESLTGGLIAATLVENAGASNVLDESYVTYAAAAKEKILGVKRETISEHGVVSAQCAAEMAAGVRRVSGADWGVSATGLAGPEGGSESTPVGTVYIGVAGAAGVKTCHFCFRGDRAAVRMQAVRAALGALALAIEQDGE